MTSRQRNEVQIPVSQLKLGMRVIRLDRPWLETDFLIQGFMVTDPDQINALARQCNYVVIESVKKAPPKIIERRNEKQGLFARLFKKKPPPSPKKIYQISGVPIAPPPPERRIVYPTTTLTSTELGVAKVTYKEAKESVSEIMEDVRIGRAIDVHNSRQAVDHIVESVIRNKDALSWLTKIKNQDDYTAEHSLNVCILSASFARFLGHSESEIRKIAMSGLLHDVGKSQVPAYILNKKGRLNSEELELMKNHPTFGRNLLLAIDGADRIAVDVAHTHHERLDGKGYPRGLTAEQIPYYAKVVALADCYDAITSSRCYDSARASLEALDIIYKCRGVQFDPNLALKFIKCIGIYPSGAVVELNSGEVGVVIATDDQNKLRPKVLLVRDRYKKNMSETVLDMNRLPAGSSLKIVKELPSGSYGVETRDYLSYGEILNLKNRAES